MFKSLKSWYFNIKRPFTDEQLEKFKNKDIQREYNRYCKIAADMKMFSDKQISFEEFNKLKALGFVESTTDCGKKVWYNSKTDITVCPVKLYHYKNLILNNKDITTNNLYIY